MTLQRKITWLCISLLLLIRLPLETGLPLIWSDLPGWLNPVFEACSYLIVAFLIWWERRDLAAFHLDSLAVWVILLAKPVQTITLKIWGFPSLLAFPQPLSWLLFLIALALLVALLLSCQAPGWPKARSLAWFLAGGLFGVVANVLVSLAMIAWMDYPVPPDPGKIALLSPLYQLGYAAVSEEPLFRAFLWGALRKAGWKDGWICLLQAALFALGHLHLLLLPQAVLNLSIVFAFALGAGWLAWRSRTIATSMAFHALWNGSQMLVYTVATTIF